MNLKKLSITTLLTALITLPCYASHRITMMEVSKGGTGKTVGTITLKDTRYGLLITPHLQSIAPGIHGFHIHQVPDCSNHGLAAGGHWDPTKSGKHLGPYGNGHLGDLPALYVALDGSATLPIVAPRLKLINIKKRALILHENGDNYSDIPKKLGGGGSRMLCGTL